MPEQSFLCRLAVAGLSVLTAGLTTAQTTERSASPSPPQTQQGVIKMQLPGFQLVVSPQLICITYDEASNLPVAFLRGGDSLPIRQSDFAKVQQHHSDDWVIGKTAWRIAPKYEPCVAYLPNVDYVKSGNNEVSLYYVTMDRRTALSVVVTDAAEVRKVRRRFTGG
jgi:hypothetical protein